ncbi:NAD(P)-dependent oxidoreductase [Yoonia sp. GPGPB17]|uniref:NAD-dependent epimerase/dehydratase family protein n=1 Tax=Yoonia sp. GPGPB17 TaxID=3026147 RepID=UPI0030C4A7CD
MAVLVTGATDFLGSHLAMALRDRGVVVTGRDRGKLARLTALGLRGLPMDLAFHVSAADRDRIGPVEAVVHCAGLSSPWGRQSAFQAANVDATQHLLELSRQLGAKRFVFVSTASVYFQFCDQDGLREGDLPPEFVNAYATTKHQAEIAVLAHGDLSPVVIRPRGIYGAGDTTLLPRLMRVAARRRMPCFSPAGATDVTHVDDVVAACIAALDAPDDMGGAIFNVSGGVGVALPDVITAACIATGVTPRWRDLPFAPTLATVRMMERLAKCMPGYPEPPVTAYALGILRYRQTMNIDAAKKQLNWQPQVSFQEGVARTFKDGALRPGVL